MKTKALEEVIQFARRHGNRTIPFQQAFEAAAELDQLRADFSAKDEELAILKHQDLYKLLIDAQKRLEKAKKVIQPLAEYFDNDTSFGWMVPLAKAWLAEVKK
jgi:hypothetical protein